MASTANLEEKLRGTLDRLKRFGLVDSYYLAGGSAIGFHFGHRRSRDLDFFSRGASVDLSRTKADLLAHFKNVVIVHETDVALHAIVEDVPIDFVRYAYPPIQVADSDLGIMIASPLDLAVMKLAAISRRGIRRDFWDLYVIATSGVALRTMGTAYVQRFGVAEPDLYHVLRALTFFDDAELESTLPSGMTPQLWSEIKRYFLQEAPRLIAKD